MDNKKSIWPLFAFGVALVIILVLGATEFSPWRISGSRTPQLAPSLPQISKTGVTMAQYQRLEHGMSYQQAVVILGTSGKEISSGETAGIRTVMYMWEGETLGANMNAMFQDGKLITKAQFGLR